VPGDDATVQLVAGRYRLDQSLGAGGSGRVWAGEDTVLQRPVAIKAVELPPYLSEQDRELLRTRVLREARAAARIDHPGTVRMFDVVDEGNTVHLVMELVSAPTLAEVADGGFLEPERAAAMGVELVDALGAAHAADIVHRDVKPRNIMVLPDGHVKLADFGIATVKDDPRITSTGMVMGTPSYMSPEQATGEGATTASDLWGLGASLYYAVEGVSPFDRGEPLPTLNAVLHDEPRDPVRAGALGPVLLSLLAKDPADRPTGPDVRRLFEAVAGGAPPEVTPTPPLVDPTLREAAPATEVVRRYEPEPEPEPERRPPPDRSRGWLVALGLVAVVAAVAAGLALLGGDDGEPEQAAATSTTSTTAPPAEDAETAPPADTEGWVTYEGDIGYAIDHPADWEPQNRSGNAVDFVDPETGDYLRVDYVSPPGPDAVQAWEASESRFRDRYPDYQRIRIEATDDGGAIWEYTFAGQHATNRAILTDEYGLALNFVADEERWDELAEVRQAFEDSFRPPD
jgi:tRNA A-37 threonylcarbamoyl transferase component Bud32